MSYKIFTVDARGNVFLEVMKDALKLNSSEVFNEIQGMFQNCIEILEKKSIKYQDLKSALVPQNKRKEIAFVFDTEKIDSSWYGYEVFEKLIPLLDERSTNSILCGDLIGSNSHYQLFRDLFIENIISYKDFAYKHHEYFYIVYINNLSVEQSKKINDGLFQFEGYVGFFDFTYSSPLKSICSNLLVRAFLKNRRTVINATEDSEDVNMTSYPFEKFGYKVVGVDDYVYGVFLSYKIEREVLPGLESDTLFSLNALSNNVLNLSDFDLEIDEKKIKYLKDAKRGNMERAGLAKISRDELGLLIKEKLDKNYIYNLEYLKEHDVFKLNIMIEVDNECDNPMKMIVSLKYLHKDKKLRLITMF